MRNFSRKNPIRRKKIFLYQFGDKEYAKKLLNKGFPVGRHQFIKKKWLMNFIYKYMNKKVNPTESVIVEIEVENEFYKKNFGYDETSAYEIKLNRIENAYPLTYFLGDMSLIERILEKIGRRNRLKTKFKQPQLMITNLRSFDILPIPKDIVREFFMKGI